MSIKKPVWQLLCVFWQLLGFGNCLATGSECFQWLSDTTSCQLATAWQLVGNCFSINDFNDLEQLPSCQPILPPTGGVRARLNGARTPHPGAWFSGWGWKRSERPHHPQLDDGSDLHRRPDPDQPFNGDQHG